MEGLRVAGFKVFIAESNNPEDFYLGRLDGHAAHEVLKVRRISSAYRIVLNREMLRKAIVYAAKAGADIFHLSCHGNADGVQLTDGECLSWGELADEFAPFATARRILVNSTCEGGHVGVSKAFREAPVRFGYLCGSSDETVGYADSCLAWSILYNVLANEESISQRAFQKAIDKVNAALPGEFVYRRWVEGDGRYKVYPSPDGGKPLTGARRRKRI
jgi:hypothetical protein